MCRPARWLPGLIPLFLLFLAAIGIKAPEIQQDLAARTGAAVAPLGLGAGAAKVSGRDVVLRGMSFSEADLARAVAAADAVDGVRLVQNRISLPGEAKPFALTATRENGAITLAGSVPSPDARARIVAAARAIGPQVDDRLTYARGGGQGFERNFEAWALAALAPLANLSRGTASLVDSALTVAGEAPGAAAYQAALAATKTLPAGLTLAAADIKPPALSPYVWSATRDGKSLTLGGAVPSEEARAAIVAAAKAGLPGLAIVDRMQIARGAGESFAGWTQAALVALGEFSRGTVSLSDSAMTIAGETDSSGAYQAALAATRTLPAGLSLARADISPPAVSPYVWSARWNGRTLLLEGFVPSEEARAAVLAAARTVAPDLSIVDRMQIARGAPAGFLPATAAAFGALGRLHTGKASLSGLGLSLSGLARGGETADSFWKQLAAALPSGFAVGPSDVRYAQMRLFVFNVKKGADGAVAVSGFAPSEALLLAALDAARAAGVSLSSDAKPGGGWPASLDFGASSAFGLGILARLKSGEMNLAEEGITIRGEGDEATISQIRALLSAPPAGVKVRLADLTAFATQAPPAPQPAAPPAPAPVAPPPPAPPPAAEAKRPLTPVEAACQQKLAARLAKDTIRFRTASAEIEGKSEDLIVDLAKVLQSCPDVRIEVAGHTDNVGAPEKNKNLSLERAKSVVNALVEEGVAADRLSFAGYGEERPIAPNDSRASRAKNRRTEFVVK